MYLITSKASDLPAGRQVQVEDPANSGGAEERQLKRMEQYAARKSERRQRRR